MYLFVFFTGFGVNALFYVLLNLGIWGLTFIGHMFSCPRPPRFFGPKAVFNSERSMLKVF